MSYNYHNNLIDYHFTVVVKSINHKTCLSLSKRIKDYLSSWAFSTTAPSEYKSAKTGEVLSREIQAHFIDYSTNTIAFREGLRCICFHYDNFTENSSVKLIDHSMAPKYN